MLKQEPKLHSESFDDFKNASTVSAKFDNEDDYQDIDEKTIAEPNITCRQQVYVNLDKDEQSTGARKVLLEHGKSPGRSSKRAGSYLGYLGVGTVSSKHFGYAHLHLGKDAAEQEGTSNQVSATEVSATGSQKHGSARKAPLRSPDVKAVVNKTRAANELAGSHMKQPNKVRGESESSVKMGTSGSTSGSALRAGVDLDAQNFSSALTDNNNY
jgi:hypothetical protein